MKKTFLIILLIMVSTAVAFSRQPERGYRGFLEFNMDFYKHFDYYPYGHIDPIYAISTSHGYQFNPHFFLGAGLMFQNCHEMQGIINFPLFIQGRTDWTFGKVPLFLDLRLGGTIFGSLNDEDDRLLIVPTVGYRLNWGRRTCANFAIGISLHGCDDSSMMTHITFHPLPSIRIGLEF